MTKYSNKVNRRLHKALITAFLTTAFIASSPIECYAAEVDSTSLTEENIDKLLDEFSLILPEEYEGKADIRSTAESLGVKRIFESVISEIKGAGDQLVGFLLTLVGIGLLSSLASLTESEMGAVASRSVGVIASALMFDRLAFLLLGAVDSLREIGDFFAAVIPVCLAVNSLGISPTTASTQAVGMGLTMSVYSYVTARLVAPVVIAVFITSALSPVGEIFGRISKGIKGVFLWIMGILTALIGATFSLQSVVAAAADNAAVRSARYAVSGTIPIVGGVVSSALGVLSGGVAYARGVVGGGAVAVVVSLVLSPLVTMLTYRTCLKAGVLFSSVTSSDGCAGVLSAFVSALDTLIAVYALSATVYIAELVAFLKVGAAVA